MAGGGGLQLSHVDDTREAEVWGPWWFNRKGVTSSPVLTAKTTPGEEDLWRV